jgi:ubiquinone/menaquinone biosynthesis C-methylase UbiE
MSKVGTYNEVTRVAWIEQTLRKLPVGSRLLDAGAGEQQFKKFCSHLNYTSQDFAQYNGAGNGIGLQTGSWNQTTLDIISDITDIPEKDCSFDAIMCTEVFEHIVEPVDAIKEFSRLIKPGGHLLITAPFCSFTHFAPFHFYSGFNSYFYKHHLPLYGFRIVDLQANGNFFEFVAQEVRRISYMSDRYINKKMSIYERFVFKLMLNILEGLARKDQSSSEFACFGYHIYAVKEE